MPSEFRSLPLSPALLDVIDELGFETLTPIQREAIPLLLEGKDLIGQSKTGSGKTVAFSLPILERLDPSSQTLSALVLSPTRELSAQVARELRTLGRKHAGLRVVTVTGGEPVSAQRRALEGGAHIAVGTPGRVLDLVKREAIDLRKVTTVVLDEADRMLEMGFEDDMKAILGALSKKRQTVLFSATFPDAIETMSRSYQRDPVRVTIDSEDDDLAIAELAYVAATNDKPRVLLDALHVHDHESALVFCNQKATVDAVAQTLARAGFSVDRLHGDLEQHDRDRVMAKFRNRSVRVLVATDVAARGLDVDDLDLVVNVDLPNQPEIYVHRIGRTGRAGKSGTAISLIAPSDEARLRAIEESTTRPVKRLSEVPRREVQTGEKPRSRAATMVTLYVAGGRKDKVRPGDILGALTGEAGGFAGTSIGKIEIHDHYTYVAVEKSIAKAAAKSLSEGRIKGRKFRAGIAE